MFIQVRLLNGFNAPLWYAIPENWDKKSYLGALVQVPLRTTLCSALVIEEQAEKPAVSFALKYARACEAFPADAHYHTFIDQLSRYYQIESLHFIKRIRHFLQEESVHHKSNDTALEKKPVHNAIELTQEQTIATDFIKNSIDGSLYTPIVIHGVTGSGKTEIYKQAILHALKQNKTIVLLFPEVTLALAFEQRLRSELVDLPLFSFHSATTPKQKKELWHLLLEQKPIVVIGVHLPILLPIAHLGLIIVDEEHEVGYQEKKHPKINTKEVALIRSKIARIPIVLGSATPSISTLYNVKERQWHYFTLKQRFAGAFPEIINVSLSNSSPRRQFWITKELENAIGDRLNKKEQTIIFINRRGFSFFVQCKQCSFIFSCTHCSVSLTLHDKTRLLCHYCGNEQELPNRCPACKPKEHTLLTKGIGTQQVVDILATLFPQARIARADLDTTTKKTSWQQTMKEFCAGNIDILVGTQTITKGYDFPKVTLVGVIWADLNLNFPLYNATETALQQLIQVAGRAGRHHKQSMVIVQSMKQYPLFMYVNETLYQQFYDLEIEKRAAVGYPPCYRLAEIVMKHKNPTLLDQEALQLVQHMNTHAEQAQLTVCILGPAQPPVHKIKNMHMRTIYLKSSSMQDIIAVYRSINHTSFKSSIFFTPNPVTG